MLQDDNDRRFRALVEHGNDCITLIDENETILYASPALLRSLGYEAHEMVGAFAGDFVHPDDAPGVNDAKFARPGASAAGTIRLRSKDGSWRWHEGTARNMLHDPAIRAYVCNRRDVTERLKLEEQLRQSQKMEAIGLLAGGVAHDFNNLLGAILGFSELGLRKLPPDHPVHAHLHEVIQAARRGADLTRKLLAFSRKQIIQARPLDINASVEDFARLLRRILGEDVDLRIDIPAQPIVAMVDAVQLEQVLLNLSTNARQAMPDGGVLRLATHAVVFDDAFVLGNPWSRAGSFAEILVSDTGTGMDAATRTRIFEPFFTTKPDGTGLGLATVYGIVQQHAGFMQVESAPGDGTTFKVYFPRVVVDVRASPVVPSTGARSDVAGRELILVAEDEPSLRALLNATLSELGYRVLMTADGEEALHAFERHADDIALVVLDVVMPRLGAREVYERMRCVRSDVKVLLTTGYAPDWTRLGELLASAQVPVLEKPFTTEALAVNVRRAIDA
jgi:PAS domain S-box-containing protein